MPPTEKDYRTLEISLIDWGGRRHFAGIFRALLISLIYRSLPVAFPKYTDELRKFLENSFTRTYENDRIGDKTVPEVAMELDELVDMNASHPFMKMSVRATGLFQRFKASPKSADKLNQRLELMYAHFSTLGDDVEIVEKKTPKKVLNEADQILKKKSKEKGWF